MLRTRDFAAWLQSSSDWPQDGPTGRQVPVLIVTDGDLPTAPDRLVVVSVGPGAPTQAERTLDVHSVQVRVRGPQANADAAEDDMATVDNIVMGAVCPVVIGGRRVVDINYQGGPPQFLLRDSGRRMHHVCTYVVTITREVF